MFKVAVGHSNDPDSDFAIAEVLEQCQITLAGDVPTAGILFAAIDFEHSLILQEINRTFPQIELIGCTTDAEMSSVLEFEQDSVTLMLFCSDEVEIRAGIGRGLSKDAVTATKQAVEQAQAKSNLKSYQLCLTTPESLTADGVLIVDGLKQALGDNFPILGGLAGDQMRFSQTYQFFNTEILSDSVPILLFSGKLLFSHGVANGWHPIGRKAVVTKADKGILYEIDHKPALDFYDDYIGGLTPSPEYPLAILDPQANEFYTRAPHDCDRKIKSVYYLAQVPEQTVVQIAQASREDILAAAKTSITKALESYPGTEPQAVLFFSCAARRQLLGTRIKEEYQLTKTSLSQALPCSGFYTHGEISPLKIGTSSRLHHDTFVTLLLGVS
ncbi:FIST signal transduction protein [Rivularia sp. UHCC 0363]|uniref:FIST signal transduction protein n=1 Tax=Rivularia sp. UHCC 0363 TaxID=3110244 RepID=UPI002B1E942B|nr:FIST N-terminal domain-containing protein [Rivularia sp. UHCC 0363]MEA5598398.1 FIST N-terminal domain-containing protein [Rivularia sp. UHCC 0363]